MPGLSAAVGPVLVSPRVYRAGEARVWRRDIFLPERPFSRRRAKKGLLGVEFSTAWVGATWFSDVGLVLGSK